MKVLDYINYESKRQSATESETAGMQMAWAWLTAAQLDSITEDDIITLAQYINGTTYWRQIPVYFADGGHAINWTLIPKSMADIVVAINWFKGNRSMTENIIKEFLVIHPFADGNGRVASLLRNWMLGTLDNPEVMPYYFGEK